MQNTVHHQQINWFRPLAWIMAIGLLLPYILLCFYAHPAGDDFHFAVPTAQWGPMTTVMGLYKSWSARYASAFFWAINPLSYHSLWGYRAFSFLLSGILFFIFLFPLSLFFKLSRGKICMLALLLLLSFLGHAKTLAEAIYNSGGFVPYSLGAAFFVSLHSFFLWAFQKGFYEKISLKSLIICGIQSFIIFLAIGFNELFMALELGFWSILFFHKLILKRTFSLPYLLFWLASVMGTLVVLLSPATFYRMEASGSFERTFSEVASMSFLAFLRFAGEIILSPGLVLAFLFLSILPCKSGGISVQKGDFFVSVFISVLVMVFCFFPSFQGEGQVQPHTYNLFQLMAIFLVVWNIFLAKVAGFNPFPGVNTEGISRNFYKWAFFLCLFLWFSPNQKPAFQDLFSGEAVSYEKERSKRMNEMESASGDSVWVDPYHHFPKSFLSSELGQGPGQWYDNLYAQYFGKQFVHLKPKR